MSLENYSVEQIQELANLADSLAKNPKTRENFLRLTKTADPSAHIPEIDTLDQMRAFAKPFEQKINSLENELNQRKIQDQILQKREALQGKGFKKDEVAEIEKLMLEKQIPSYDTAADFYRMQKQTAAPTPSTMTPISLPKDGVEKFKGGGQSGLNQWARGEAFSIIDAMKSGKTLV